MVLVNPEPMALWGLIVVALLALGSVPLFVGLLFVLPILGHATWHLYRRTVEALNSDRYGSGSLAMRLPSAVQTCPVTKEASPSPRSR